MQAEKLFDRVSEIIIEQFNSAQIPYGNTSKHCYPVKKEDVLAPPVIGGSERPFDECRALIAYIIFNHVPVQDVFRQTDALPTRKSVCDFIGRRNLDKPLKTGCRLVHNRPYRKAYVGSLMALATQGIDTWVGRSIRSECTPAE